MKATFTGKEYDGGHDRWLEVTTEPNDTSVVRREQVPILRMGVMAARRDSVDEVRMDLATFERILYSLEQADAVP